VTAAGTGRPDDARLRAAFAVVERAIEDRWGIPVVVSDVKNPFTGDLDGAEIKVDYDLTAEDALFIVVHLFGHTAQWNTSAAARELGRHPGPWTDDVIARVKAYELEAARYSLQLFHDCGVDDLDGWLSDFSACDLAYLEHFYRTGERGDFRRFWQDGAPRLTPLAIPPFTPQRWLARWDGVVI